MSTTTQSAGPGSGPPDDLDRLLGEYFKSRMPHPWPAAPATTSAEPARPAFAETGGRARTALVASIALLFGGYFLVSGGWRPADRPATPKSAPGSAPGLLPGSDAKLPKEFDQGGKGKAPGPAFKPGNINLP